MTTYSGWDISPTHGAAVAIDDSGEIVDFAFLSPTIKGLGRPADPRGSHWGDLKAVADNEVRDMLRLPHALRLFLSWTGRLIPKGASHHAAIEAYAFRAAVGAHTKGEIGGMCRLALLRAGALVRSHDPTSVKMFATGRGDAEKDDMAAGVAKRWGQYVLDQFPAHNAVVVEDLVDAYVMARMARSEDLVRSGRVAIKDLPDNERRIFLRVTKTMPVNLLDRPYATIAPQ